MPNEAKWAARFEEIPDGVVLWLGGVQGSEVITIEVAIMVSAVPVSHRQRKQLQCVRRGAVGGLDGEGVMTFWAVGRGWGHQAGCGVDREPARGADQTEGRRGEAGGGDLECAWPLPDKRSAGGAGDGGRLGFWFGKIRCQAPK